MIGPNIPAEACYTVNSNAGGLIRTFVVKGVSEHSQPPSNNIGGWAVAIGIVHFLSYRNQKTNVKRKKLVNDITVSFSPNGSLT